VAYDYCVLGGGIVGLATALKLLEFQPGARVVVLEKEPGPGRHQTGHNSGVIHAGVYYAPGSLKARLCKAGAQATIEFCQQHDIPYRRTGKLLVATTPLEVDRLQDVRRRAEANGLDVEPVDQTELRRREPQVSGLSALLVASTGIVDFGRVAAAMAREVRAAGGTIEVGTRVTGITEGARQITVTAGNRRWDVDRLVVCGGLQADRLAAMAGLEPDFQIIPFRGEYYRLRPERRGIVSHLIYPVPDPELPFLGVHLSPTIDGPTTVGPNAVLALSREGYPWLSVSMRDVATYARFPGMWRVARTHWRTGAVEMRNSISKRAYLRMCQRYCPDLRLADLLPMRAGIRAQAVQPDGTLVHDFLLRETERSLHVCNAPSPAATSAVPIGEMIARRMVDGTPIPTQ